MFRFRDSKQPSWWKSLYVTFEIISLMLVTSGVETVPLSDFFPFNTSAGDRLTDTSDDGGSGEIKIKTLFPFFNRSYDKIYVNNNGIITFLAELKTYRPEYFPLDTDTPVIAPFWADVDVQVSGHVWYRQSTFAETLAKASAEIRTYFPALEKFVATWALIVTWDNVGFHGASEQGAHMVGFNAGDKKTFEEIPGARKDAVRNITLTSNVNVPGKWVFQVNIVSINEGSATNDDNEDINIVGVVAAGTSTSLTTGMVFGGCIFFWRRMKRRNFEEEKTKEEAQTKKLFDPKQRPPHPPPGGAPPLARI